MSPFKVVCAAFYFLRMYFICFTGRISSREASFYMVLPFQVNINNTYGIPT